MTSSKPYLIRAIYEWIEDNELTPYIYVNTMMEGVALPSHLLLESPLVLNISSVACMGLLLQNDGISFQARFSGEVFSVYLPMASVLAIVSQENGEGMRFSDESLVNSTTDDEALRKKEDIGAKKRPSLKVIK